LPFLLALAILALAANDLSRDDLLNAAQRKEANSEYERARRAYAVKGFEHDAAQAFRLAERAARNGHAGDEWRSGNDWRSDRSRRP